MKVGRSFWGPRSDKGDNGLLLGQRLLFNRPNVGCVAGAGAAHGDEVV